MFDAVHNTAMLPTAPNAAHCPPQQIAKALARLERSHSKHAWGSKGLFRSVAATCMAVFAISGTQPCCAIDEAEKECDPGFEFKRDGWGCGGPCPEGQVCQDMTRCAPMGCSKAPECASVPEKYGLDSRPSSYGYPTAKVRTVTGKTRVGQTIFGFKVITADETIGVAAHLPSDMDLRIHDAVPVSLKLCYHGNPINPGYSVVLRDEKGVLIAAGGRGIDAAITGCLAPEVVVAREDLDCAPFPDGAEYTSGGPPHANYALSFTSGGTKVTVPQRGRALLVVKGVKYKVANFSSYHHIETPATDIEGAWESFALVRVY